MGFQCCFFFTLSKALLPSLMAEDSFIFKETVFHSKNLQFKKKKKRQKTSIEQRAVKNAFCIAV